jgi:hypothetical protein
MGRWYYGRKATADESCRLKMSYLRKRGMLSGQATGEIAWTSSMTGKTTTVLLAVDVTDHPCAKLVYTITDREGNKTDYDYEVSLVTTPCNFGGVRYWFGCPSCGYRVGVLYLSPGDVYFRCRHCNNLSYRSRNRCRLESWGETSRQIDKLYSEIKHWTWKGRPTREVRKLRALERKFGILSGPIGAQMEKFKARLR